MAITPKNLVRHELIGLKVYVKDSANPSLRGIRGRVVDETYNLLVIETAKGDKKVPKKLCIFVFTLPNRKKVKVDGKLLVARPEDRIKKKFPKW